MKRLDLSCLPLKLDVGEVMEVIDHEGKYHLIKCVQSKNGGSWCEGCFFAKTAKNFSCTQIKCSRGERDEDVRYIELPGKNEFEEEEREMKTLTFNDLSETETIKGGEVFIYVDCLGVQHKIIAKKVGTLSSSEACERCVFNNDACSLVNCFKIDKESEYNVYYEEFK